MLLSAFTGTHLKLFRFQLALCLIGDVTQLLLELTLSQLVASAI